MSMPYFRLTVLSAACVLALAACNQQDAPPASSRQAATPAVPAAVSGPAAEPMAQPDAQMQAVLDQLAALGAKPLETLTPEQARAQATPADAVAAVLSAASKPTTPETVASVKDSTFPGPAGPVPIRIYKPAGSEPMPVVLYIHGGGWVIANLDTYDASPRALANLSKAIIVSTHYRQAPEHKFPAAHDDTLAAYKWLLANATELGGDANKIAVVGESAGGNMAADIAIAARDQKLQAPLAQILVYPVAGNDTSTPSYLENAMAKPLSKPAMEWFIQHTFNSPQEAADPRINLVARTDLAGVAPATIILAQIDPLRSEGQAYADALKNAGVPVTVKLYDGVTHEFFGMGAVVDKARQAEEFAASRLREAFTSGSSSDTDTAPSPATPPAN